MMKNLLFLMILAPICLLSSCDKSDSKIYHYEEYGLNRPVKSVKVTTYEAKSKFGDIVKGELEWDGHYLAKFNDVGNIESIQEFDNAGDLTGVVKYRYDALNNVIASYDYDEDGECVFSLICEYDGAYLVKQTITNYYRNEPEITTCEFFRTGEWITETKVSVNNELSTLTKYSKSGKMGGEWITYDKEGQELSKGVQKLNKRGRVVEHCDNDILRKIEWNDKNLPVHLTNAFLYRNTMVSWYVEESPEYEIEYEYDNKGNWIKQIVYECDGDFRNPVTISEREIFY